MNCWMPKSQIKVSVGSCKVIYKEKLYMHKERVQTSYLHSGKWPGGRVCVLFLLSQRRYSGIKKRQERGKGKSNA